MIDKPLQEFGVSVTCHVCDSVEFITDSTGNAINCAECGEDQICIGLGDYLDNKTRMDIRGNDNEILYDEVDWQLIKTSKGQDNFFYIMVDKMAGTNIRIEYHDDAWAIRDMLKIMRKDST